MTRRAHKFTGLVAAAILAVAATPALAADPAKQEDGPWLVRLRALGVITRDAGKVNGVSGSDLSFSDTAVPEFDVSYFFTKNIAAELILATTYADVDGKGSISSLGKIGKTWVLPPTVTLQYHFTDFGAFKPYVGAGINYTMFYSQSAASARSLNVKDTFGLAFQVGADYRLNEYWGLNVDVKKLYLRPDFDVNVGGANMSGEAKLDPWLIGAGVTYRF